MKKASGTGFQLGESGISTNSWNPDDPVWFQLNDPVSGAPIEGVEFCMAGSDSAQYTEALNAYAMARGKALQASGRDTRSSYTDVLESNMFICIYCCVDWRGVLQDGKPVPCTRESCSSFFGTPKMRWAIEQLVPKVQARGNYFRRGDTALPSGADTGTAGAGTE